MAARDDAYYNMVKLAYNMPNLALVAMQQTLDVAKDICKQTTAFQDDTGNLRKSIDAGITDKDNHSVTGALSAGSKEYGRSDEYSGLVELGHRGPGAAPPHRYVGPTMQQITGAGVLAHNLVMQFFSELG